MRLVIERFDPRRATEADLAGYHGVVTASEAADRPGEPGLPFEELIGRLTRPLPGMGPAAHWVGYRGLAALETRLAEKAWTGRRSP